MSSSCLTDDGLCIFHEDLLPMDCTLVARLGCPGCMLSNRNLDPPPEEDCVDVDLGETRCPHCQDALRVVTAKSGALVALGSDMRVHRHVVEYSIPIGQEARAERRSVPAIPIPRFRSREIPDVS